MLITNCSGTASSSWSLLVAFRGAGDGFTPVHSPSGLCRFLTVWSPWRVFICALSLPLLQAGADTLLGELAQS